MAKKGSFSIVPVLAGPTGVGKTFLTTLIAEKLPLEVVSADSRQIYKHLDIGTAKPSADIMNRILHHFIDILEPDQFYSAGEYSHQARAKIKEILAREKVPLVAGGSGLYIRSLFEGFFQDDVRDEKIRESLQHRLEQEGSEALYRDLKRVDEASAKKIHPNNSQRILRALEVYLASGEPLSELQERKLPPPPFRPLKFALNKERKVLYNEINQRVERMFEAGLLGEVAHIFDLGFDRSLNSLNSVGYKEVIRYLDGEIDFDTCVEQVKRNTRRYAKRQLTWFRADEDFEWFMVNEPDDYQKIAEEISCRYQKIMEGG